MTTNAFEVKTEELKLEEVVGEGTSQIVVSDMLTLPEAKPPIAAVVDYVAKEVINKVTVFPGKVVVDGVIQLSVVYEAAVPYQTVHVFHGEVPFSTFVEIPGVEPGMTIDAKLVTEHFTFEIRPDGRGVVARGVIMLFVRATKSTVVCAVVDITGYPGAQITKELIRAETILGEGTAQSVIREILMVPEQKPPISSILDHVASIQVTSTTVLPNKVIVNGTIHLRTIYEARVPTQCVHVVHHTIPFERFVEVPGVKPDMSVAANAKIEFVSLEPGNDGRTIHARFVVEVAVKVVQVQSVQVVTHVAGIEGITIKKEKVRVQEVLGENKSQAVVRELVDIPDEKPLAKEVIDSTSTPEVKRVIVAPGKVIVDGTIAQRIMYEPLEDPTQTVHTLHYTISFSEIVVLPEAKPGMAARVSVKVEHANFEVPPAGEPVMVTKVLELTARVFRTREMEIVVYACPVVKECYGIVTGDLVNVREGPGTHYPVITQVHAGTTVQVLDIRGDWIQVKLQDKTVGWMFASYVKHDCLPRG